MKIGGATVNQIPFHWENNTRNIIDAIEEAKRQGIHLLCFPELSITGYGCEDVFLSDWIYDEIWKEVEIIKQACAGITVSVGLPLRFQNETYNGALVIDNKKILGITCKQFLANDGIHYEPRWFTPWPSNKVASISIHGEEIQIGDLTYVVQGITLGFEICEDGWQGKQRPGYRLKERGVQVIFNPSASHFAMGKSVTREHDIALAGSALFQCVYVFANLVGNEAGRVIYDGDIIIAQEGKLLAVNERFTFKPYHVSACTIDFNDSSKSEHFPIVDSKDNNEELSKAVALALFDYHRKSKSGGFVLSLSGGADSSACAIMVAEMVRYGTSLLGFDTFCKLVGIEPVNSIEQAVGALLTCAYQGTKNSSTQTLQAASALAKSIGATFYQWTIDEQVTNSTSIIETAIGRSLTWEKDDITLQNIQARSRSPLIWMLANVKRAVLLTTSNRSEGDVGYATMDGDTSGSLAPIAGLSKVFILQWLQWAEKTKGYSGLQYVNNLQPTAELRPLERNQTDEADLMPYSILNTIEEQAILHRKSPIQIYNTLKVQHDPELIKKYIHKFFRMWAANQWKRERLAPSFHLDQWNVDPRSWCRFPILSSGFKRELEALESLP
jgi:NAD+ synthase (glutamine-hydrolysing)